MLNYQQTNEANEVSSMILLQKEISEEVEDTLLLTFSSGVISTLKNDFENRRSVRIH